ncbi:MAG TPA: TetR/AcrR family transcriptional regulator [Marmoricola sp.]|jgi:AcrR family transcriptional regulator|nr:TetR/AcrR family transcriptional regulator [Marmoricola sp.]
MSNDDLKVRFFDAALEILATDGYGGLKLAAVCKRLKVTTGAFYHAFSSWNEFTVELLDTWRRERTTELADLSRSAADPVEQLQRLLVATLEFRHQAEAAIRVWAALDAEVAEVQQRVDAERYEVVVEAMTKLVGKKDASRYANWGVNILIGFEISTNEQVPVDLEWQLTQVLLTAVAQGEARKATRKTARKTARRSTA